MRRQDAVTARMIAALMRLERAPWPAARPAYAAMLTALAIRCEAQPAAVAEMYRWLRAGLASALAAGSGDVRKARREALSVVAAEIAGLLHACRASLDRARRPNLMSMLGFQVRRRARDLLVVERRYHARFGGSWDWAPPVVGARAERMTLVAEVVRMLDTGEPDDRALLLVAQGHSIAAAARRTGASRQAIYRRRERLRAELEGDSDA